MSRAKSRGPRFECLESRNLMSAGGPSAQEQYLLELINEARTNPPAAAERATTNLDLSTQVTLNHFGVNAAQARQEIAAAPRRPALAWNARLAAAALDHSRDLARNRVQSHTGSDGSNLDQRLERAGYANRRSSAENVFAYAESAENASRAFLVDWGVASRAHRANIQQTNGGDSFQEAGVALVPVSGPGIGPFVATQVFARRADAPAQVLGVVYDDRDGNHFYGVGEGEGNLTVQAVNLDTNQVAGTATTWDSGGYQIALPAGRYQIVARDGSQVVGRRDVTVGGENVKVDFDLSQSEPEPIVVAAPAPVVATTRAPVVVTAPTPVAVAPTPVVAPTQVEATPEAAIPVFRIATTQPETRRITGWRSWRSVVRSGL